MLEKYDFAADVVQRTLDALGRRFDSVGFVRNRDVCIEKRPLEGIDDTLSNGALFGETEIGIDGVELAAHGATEGGNLITDFYNVGDRGKTSPSLVLDDEIVENYHQAVGQVHEERIGSTKRLEWVVVSQQGLQNGNLSYKLIRVAAS